MVTKNAARKTVAPKKRGAAHGVAYENDLLVGNSLDNGHDIFAVLFHRPVGAAFGGAAVTGEIDGDHCVFRLEGGDLRVPVVGVGGPAVDENDRGVAFAGDPVFDMHAVRFRGELC